MQHTPPPYKALTLLCALLLTALVGCGLAGSGVPPTLTPPPSPTPQGNVIFFDAPYHFPLTANTIVPRTRIRYTNEQDGLHTFFVDGLVTYKRLNDALIWQGVIAPGVAGDYRLTVTTELARQLVLDGTVRLAVFNPRPIEVPLSSLPSTPPDFFDIPISYVVPQGHQVPGSSLVYEGQEGDLARLSGGQAYPLYPLGNSVTWSGRLLNNVLIRYDLVVSRLDEYGLGLSGTARLWILR